MSHHARIEEVSDSDPDDMDPTDFDPSQSLLAPADIPSTSRAPSSSSSPTPPPAAISSLPGRVSTDPARDRERSKNWQCLYPVYFDGGRSRAEGRRVGREQGVPNPLAREILDAVGSLGIRDIVFEPMKIHPKDWANPGRVRVLIKEGGRATGGRVKNSMCSFFLSYSRGWIEWLRSGVRMVMQASSASAAPPLPRALNCKLYGKTGRLIPVRQSTTSTPSSQPT